MFKVNNDYLKNTGKAISLGALSNPVSVALHDFWIRKMSAIVFPCWLEVA